MIFTLITLAALLASPAALTGGPSTDPAALLPANTILYVGTPSLQAGAEAAKNSAMRKILDEPEVKAFLQKPVSAADKSLQELIAKSGLPPEAMPRISLAGMLSGEGGGVPISRFFLALTHVSLPAPGAGGGPAEPDVGLVLGIEMQNESDLGLVKALWGMIKAPETSATHGTHSYMVKKIEGGPPVVLGFIDKLAVLTLSEKSLGAILDNSAAATGATLADTAEYKQAVGLGGGMKPDSSTWFFRMGQLADMGRSLLGIVAMTHSDIKELAGVSALLDQTGISSVHWMGGEAHREADGRVITTMGVSIAPDATGLVGKCVAASTPVDLGMLSTVPGNCLSMSAFGVDWLPHVYDFVMSTIETVAPEEAPVITTKIKEFMGTASLRDDLLANPHGVALLYGMPGEGFPGQPSTICKVALRDPQKFVGAMNSLAAGVAAQFPDFKGLKINESEHEGHPFYEIDLSSTPGAVIMLQPAFALDGNNVVLCLQSSKALKTALNGVQGAGSLADNSELMTFAKGLAAKGKVTSLSFSDNAKSFGTVYGQLAPAVGMMSGMFGALPVDFSLMPTEQAIGKHLGYSYDGTYDAGGGLEVGRGVAEFALGDFVPILLTGGVIAVGVMTGEGMGEPEAAPDLSPAEQVQNDLQQLSAAMTVYKISQGGYPKELADLVKPLPDYEEGCLGKPDLPKDPWGNGYLFKLNEKKKPFLWSAGPNGQDEAGAGDDIAKK